VNNLLTPAVQTAIYPVTLFVFPTKRTCFFPHRWTEFVPTSLPHFFSNFLQTPYINGGTTATRTTTRRLLLLTNKSKNLALRLFHIRKYVIRHREETSRRHHLLFSVTRPNILSWIYIHTHIQTFRCNILTLYFKSEVILSVSQHILLCLTISLRLFAHCMLYIHTYSIFTKSSAFHIQSATI
jgi:hypothetical protein